MLSFNHRRPSVGSTHDKLPALLASSDLSVDSHSIDIHGSATSNHDTLQPPTTLSRSSLPDTSTHHLLNHHNHPLLNAHITFDPVVRIIRTPDDEDSSDDIDNLPALISTSHRPRNIPTKGPVRLCTKKFTLPLNISTSSLIGNHHNQSTSSLPSSVHSGPQSVRQLYEQTRQEIEEDEQFIPDAPRHLNLVLPLLTRQPSRRTIRQQEKRRIERWRELFGGGKSSLKSSSSHYSHLYFLSADLRKLLSESSLPVQLSTNTAINSIHAAISPADIRIEPSETKLPAPPKLTNLEKGSLQSHPCLSSSDLLDHGAIASQPARIPNLVIDELSYPQSETQPPSQQNAPKVSRFGWLGSKLKAGRFSKQRAHHNPSSLPDASSNPPMEKRPTLDPLIEGAPLKRMSTPRAPVDDTATSGTPLQRTSTPAIAIQKQSAFGAPLQRSTTPGAPLERKPTPGTPLKRFLTSSYTSSSTSKSNSTSFLRRLIHWPTKPFLANQASTNNILDYENQSEVRTDKNFMNSERPHMANISKTSLLLGSGETSSSDKWGNRREVSLRQCCQVCITVAELGRDPSHEIIFSTRARKHYYSKSWFLEDVLKQDGIPAHQVKLLSKELGAPYDAWVAQVVQS